MSAFAAAPLAVILLRIIPVQELVRNLGNLVGVDFRQLC